MKVAVLGAMEEEVEVLKSALSCAHSLRKAGMDVFRGNFGNTEIACSKSGMGLVAAAAAAQFLVDSFCPDYFIFSGIAGGLSDQCGIGEVIIGKTARFLDADMDLIKQDCPYMREFRSDPTLVKLAEKALGALSVPYKIGSLASSNRFIGSNSSKKRARESSGADAVEMEGAAFLQVCAKNEVPALVLRTISDGACQEYSSFRHFDTSSYSHQSAKVVLEILKIMES